MRSIIIIIIMRIVAILAALTATCDGFSFLSPPPSWTHALEHLLSPPLQITPLEELANTRIPGPSGSNVEILAYMATPSGFDSDQQQKNQSMPSIILIHEFFGLNPSIVEKAQGLADDLGCIVVAPDTFRGVATDFIPKAIWLALTTPQERVNDDLNAVCSHLEEGIGLGKLAVMGFCYGGGKAIRYTTQCRPEAATVIFYGSPLTDVEELRRLKGPVCAIYGNKDAQFPMALLDKFRASLERADIENTVRVYDGVGHAFWTNMEEVKRGDQPQLKAYEQCVSFLQGYFFGN